MREFRPTPSQSAAIESRGSAVLVSAGAGSGKTRVLTARLMRYLTDRDDPKDIDGFLVITFTRAAAAELKGRIMTELAAAAAAEPTNRHLRRQSALCRRASIQTIDGFCADLLRQNCHQLNLAPDFRIIEDERAALMKAAALERTMEERYERADEHPGFLALADTVGAGRDDRRLCELVLDLHGKMQCHARPDKWAESMIEQLRAPVSDAGQTPWGRELLEDLRCRADYWSAELERVLALMREDEKTQTCYASSIETGAEQLREFSRALRLGWDRARGCPLSFPKVSGVRKPTDPELTEYVKARRASCMEACREMEKILNSSSEELLAGMALTHDAMEELLRLTLDFDAEYARAKRRGSLMDYADLEHYAARLLTDGDGAPTPLAREISERYTEIMVDEYQDVSRVQDTIFRALSRGGKNLFLVGDVKQSIYRFRLAEPEIFTGKYESYRDWTEAAPGEPRRILLRENFRSRREILSAANAVFSACMSRALGDVDYDDAAALRYGADSYSGECPIPELLLLGAPKNTDDDGEKPGRLEREAEMVARKIEEMVRARLPVTGRDGLRPMSFGDVAILLRTVANVGGVFRRALLRRGIPVASAQGGDFFTSLEISTVMSLLTIIDNPHQDVPLIAVLRSPCFGFTADELSAIRAADRDADYFDALCRRAESDEKCRGFLEKLRALRAVAPDIGCAELVWQIVEELDLLAVAGVMEDGERRRENLMELIALSEEFESTGWRGLHRFVLWLRRLAEKGRESAASAAGGVRILSIHRSKGLEYPVVFLCDLARRFNLRDTASRVLVHPELGLGAKVTDLERRIEYPTLSRTAIARRITRESLSEEMRLLYVAMTRAKEYLYLSACVPDPEKLIEKLRPASRPPLAAEALAGESCPLNWIVTAILSGAGERLGLRICTDAGTQESEEAAPDETAPDEAFLAELERKLAFRYPHRNAESLPSKVTATELKDRAETDEDAADLSPRRPAVFRVPDFAAQRKPLSGAARGTATHLVLQYMDFAQTGSEEAVRAEIERMRRARYLSDREAEAVDAQAIVRLFASPLGRRMLGAQALRREFKFSLLCSARELLGAEEDEQVLLQGVVDCCLEEDGELVIVDYKTDAIRTEAQLEERRALYVPQLRAYAAAMERIFRKPVKECVLYFLSMGREARI